MRNYTVRRYNPEDYGDWNAFVGKAKNATFLFHRDFMEYHSDRFADYSLIVTESDKTVAVLPAHRKDNAVYSHNGLTYGGLVYGDKTKLTTVIESLKAVLSFLESDSITTLHIKMIPTIYHLKPAEELSYALFLAQAKLTRRDSLSVIDLNKTYSISKSRRQSIRRGLKNGLVIKEETEFKKFWNDILIPNLDSKHAAKPVHSLEEIEKLHNLFPKNIRHFNVYHENKIVAGTTVFISENVAHPQYISGQEDKNQLGSLDFLYHHLLIEVFADKRFFDFGVSNEEHGKKLNESLVFWKESFGASTITQDFYEVNTANHALLANVLL